MYTLYWKPRGESIQSSQHGTLEDVTNAAQSRKQQYGDNLEKLYAHGVIPGEMLVPDADHKNNNTHPE